MFESIMAGFLNFFHPSVLLFTLMGIVIGLVFGIIPGISGLSAMAIVLPLTYGMNPMAALCILTAIQAVAVTGGSLTSILINIPGTGANAATLLDGFPMTKKGEGGRACGATLCAAAMGGLAGGIVLALLIPIAYPITLLFGSGETALMGLLGLTFIAVMAQGSTIKSFISGFIGILLSFIGVHAMTGVTRYTFGSLYLYDGFDLIPFILGIYALPEIFELIFKRGGALAEVDKSVLKQIGWAQVREGILDVFRHWYLFIRCSIIGVIIGIIPGVGAAVSQFVCYGHAKQSSKHPETFGHGNVEGVIAPEAGNNAKEGGSFLPTLAFGIPGSSSMAVMLGAFLIFGIQPGPAMLSQHLDITWTLIICLILSNIFGAVILLPFISTFAKTAFVPGRYLVPVILVISAFGCYAARLEFLDIVTAFIFGIMGYAMVKGGFDRVSLLLGFILGSIVERYLSISIAAMGASFLLRPTSAVLTFCIVLLLVYSPLKKLIQNIRRKREAYEG